VSPTRPRPGQRCPAALDCAVSVRFPTKRCRTDRAASASNLSSKFPPDGRLCVISGRGLPGEGDQLSFIARVRPAARHLRDDQRLNSAGPAHAHSPRASPATAPGSRRGRCRRCSTGRFSLAQRGGRIQCIGGSRSSIVAFLAHASVLQCRERVMLAPFGRAKSVAVMSATHFFVALACIPDLLKCAKHLFVAAILAGQPASHPISQGTGHHRADGPRQARSQGDVPLVAATPVQDLRFRANDLLKLTAPLAAHDRMPARPPRAGSAAAYRWEERTNVGIAIGESKPPRTGA
jgi:hypothetical protein